MSEIEYGYLNNKNEICFNTENMRINYILQTPEQCLKNKIGVCWDQVELERDLFDGYDIQTFFIVYYNGEDTITHTFLTYKKDNKYYWYEHSWQNQRGIHVFESLEALLQEVAKKHLEELNTVDINVKDLCIYQYDKPKYNISDTEFFTYCTNGKPISVYIERKGLI